jgi:secreted PhoX family phosphatase
MNTFRREFLRSAAGVTLGFFGLRCFVGPKAQAQDYQNDGEAGLYGPLIPDPRRVFDLPRGFAYRIISRMRDVMSDGLRTPGAPDGMAAFAGPDGKILLVRNHELNPNQTFEGAFGVDLSLQAKVDPRKLYDAGSGQRPHMGGTTTLLYNPATGQVEKEFLSLAGTARNCAGGPTPWGSWITCEETEDKRPAEDDVEENLNEKDHGYNFEVPARAEMRLVDPVPLKDMGRFRHEAVAVEPFSGIVYQTEDQEDGLIYRFLPNEYGKLHEGGKLQALAVRDVKSCDTRNWAQTGKPKLVVGERRTVEWVDMEEVDSPKNDLRTRGFQKGAACFARGEGMWYGNKEVFFACTSGGISQTGQVFRYVPSSHEGTSREAEAPGTLELYLEPNNTHLLEHCDNLCVAPWGDLVLCEDGLEYNYLRGVTPEGRIYTIGNSAYHLHSELCGVCFAPNHPTLFVNLQRPGLTLAITGPWNLT